MSIAAILSSQVLSQLSTVRNADGLICRVRNETGSFPAAMAAMLTYVMIIFLLKKVVATEQEKKPKTFLYRAVYRYISCKPLFRLCFYPEYGSISTNNHSWGAAPPPRWFFGISQSPRHAKS